MIDKGYQYAPDFHVPSFLIKPVRGDLSRSYDEFNKKYIQIEFYGNVFWRIGKL